VTRYGAPTSSQATASEARSRWTSVAAANVPIVAVAISTIRTEPPAPPRVIRRSESDGTRSRRIAASRDTPSSAIGSTRTATIPAARPASAGTTAMNGSTPVSFAVLLAPATPRSTSRYAPRIARTTRTPRAGSRRGEGRRTIAASRPGPRGAASAVGALAATRISAVTTATRTAAMTVRAGRARRQQEERERGGERRWRQGDDEALDQHGEDQLAGRRATGPAQGERRPAAVHNEDADEGERRDADGNGPQPDDSEHRRDGRPALLDAPEQRQQPALEQRALDDRPARRRERPVEPAEVGDG
jgi:hypothetical protein